MVYEARRRFAGQSGLSAGVLSSEAGEDTRNSTFPLHDTHLISALGLTIVDQGRFCLGLGTDGLGADFELRKEEVHESISQNLSVAHLRPAAIPITLWLIEGVFLSCCRIVTEHRYLEWAHVQRLEEEGGPTGLARNKINYRSRNPKPLRRLVSVLAAPLPTHRKSLWEWVYGFT